MRLSMTLALQLPFCFAGGLETFCFYSFLFGFIGQFQGNESVKWGTVWHSLTNFLQNKW